MPRTFSEAMSALRREQGLSQRKAASELHISQALLSHYENGAREPGLEFVVRACDYYGVSADYLLGRTDEPGGAALRERLRSLSKEQVRQRQKVSVLSVLGVGAAIGLAVLVLMGYIQLTAISSQVVDLQEELEALETENVSLTAQHEQMFDLATVKEVAEAAGMSQPSSSQIYYIDLSRGDSAVVYQQEEPNLFSRLLTSLNHGIYAVIEYFE